MKPFVRRTTVFIYTEGPHEMHFIKHAKGLYVPRGSNVKVDVASNHGGDADAVVMQGIRRGSDYDLLCIMYDTDISTLSVEVRKFARDEGVILVEGSPAHEAMLLSILRPGSLYSHKTTDWCKKEFHRNYISERDRTDVSRYGLFTREILENNRNSIPELDAILTALEGRRWEE